jgi:GTPase SAR1 family protein
MAAQLKLRHFEVSAKTGKRVSELFDEILDILLQHMRREEEFVESTREKLKDLNTIQEEGVEPRGEGDHQPISLRTRAL